VKVLGRYEWIVDSIRVRRPTEAGQARLVIAWLVAFLAHLGLLLEEADGSALEAFCHRASLSRTDASMNRLVFTIRNVYAELHSRDWVGLNPASSLRWTFCRQRRCTLDIDLSAIQELLEHMEYRRFRATSEEEVRNRCCVHLAVDAGLSCSELSALNVSDLGRNKTVLVATGEPRERIARLSPQGHLELSLYLDLRRDLFGLGSEALFVSTRGSRDRLPLRSIAQAIQTQIEEAGLEGRIIPADLGRHPAAKLISEGAAPHDAVLMLGYKRIPGGNKGPTTLRSSDALKLFHPLYS
jgi:site-specific recombinase XerD